MSIKDLKPGEKTILKELVKEEKKTTPPSRFTESSLIASLDDKNIGRPSTYSSIVSLIQDRGYVRKIGNQLVPTFLGFSVVNILTHKFPKFTAYQYTAEMEENLEKIIEGKLSRENFLKDFWRGDYGLDNTVNKIIDSIDYEEISKLCTIDLNNGYSIYYNKFGARLQDNSSEKNSKGYLPSVYLGENEDFSSYDFSNPEVCKELFDKASNKTEDRELGELKSGEYAGWRVTVKDGRFGKFLQAVDSTPKSKRSPVSHPLPENLDIHTVSLEEVEYLFAEVKLPRWSEDKLWLVGIGKRGPYIGKKVSVKSRPVFRSLPEGEDPRTISFDKVKEYWYEKDKLKEAEAVKKTAKKQTAKKSQDSRNKK